MIMLKPMLWSKDNIKGTFFAKLQSRPVARIDFGGCGTPKEWTFWIQKVDFFEPHPPYPPTKNPFLAHFVAKSGPFGRFGGVCRTPCTPPPPATGLLQSSHFTLVLQPVNEVEMVISTQMLYLHDVISLS